MAFQVSPGVNITEIDKTDRVSPAATSDAAIAAGFQWGPSNKLTTITSERELVSVFGKPDADPAANWLTASSFLSYGGSLQVIRTLDTAGMNASSSAGVSKGFQSVYYGNGESAAWQASQTHTGVSLSVGGSGATVTIVTDAQGEIESIEVTAAGTGYDENDTTTVTDPGSTSNTVSIAVDTLISGGGNVVLIENEDQFDAGATLGTASFLARYPGALGNGIEVKLVHTDGFIGWDSMYIQNGKQVNISFEALFDRAPGTSNYVLSKNGNVAINDEVNVVVVDAAGDISGRAGTVLEKFAHVSLASDAKDENGNSNYIKDVIRNNGKYIYATGQWDQIATGWESATATSTTVLSGAPEGLSVRLAGGVGDNAVATATSGNGDAARYTADQKGYGLLRDVDTTDVGILISGNASVALQQNLIDNVAEYRKDAITVISPERGTARTAIIGTGTNATKATALTTWQTTLGKSSSYAIADSGYKRMYDPYNDVYRDIPLNGDIAGLIVRTENNQDAWWSPAGFTRGQIKNVVKLHFNPDKAARDTIYKVGVNPVVSMPGQGTLLYGDKTLLAKPSAFDRINVRRLFVVLEKSISRAAKNLLFEFNDEFTRASFKNMVEPFLRNIKARRGVYDYLVICDSTNNTSEVIDRNEFVGDIFIKPARSINFIQLNFVAVRSGVEFSEVVGSV